MSFILDALKKSEAERNRQAGPTLYEMRAAPRRAPLPTWVVIILGVLVLNLVGLGYLLLRRPATSIAPPAPAATVAVPAATPSAVPAAAPAAAASPTAAPAIEPLSIKPAAATPVEAPADVEAPAQRPESRAAQRAIEGHVASIAEMTATGANLPALRLALHAYDAESSRRFILLKGLRLREGETTPEGLRVERIVEDGAVLAWRGRRFMLPRGE
jgi:general secretion pathway protein B